jgi:hypothetical protein
LVFPTCGRGTVNRLPHVSVGIESALTKSALIVTSEKE